VAARKQKQRRMSAQVVEDEDYQLRYEIAAGIDVAKESAVLASGASPRQRLPSPVSGSATSPAKTRQACQSAGHDYVTNGAHADRQGRQ
jgi:hypothetical protein